MYDFHLLHLVENFRLNCLPSVRFCEFFELPADCRGSARQRRFTAAGTHSPWVGGGGLSVCTAAQNLLCPCIAAAAEYDQGTAATQSRPEVENNRRAAIGDRPP